MSEDHEPDARARVGMPSRAEWRVFGTWALVGVGSIWATWTLLTYGWVLAVVTSIAAVLLANREEPGRSAWGFVTGMGIVPLWVGWVNRATVGPLSPWWWIGTGAATVVIGLLVFLRPRRRT